MGLVNDTEYTIKVRAKNAVDYSAAYSEAKGTPVAATEKPVKPGQPTTVVEYNAITVSWAGVTGATKYQVVYGPSDNLASATQYGGDITTLSTTITVAATGTYYVWVRAENSKGYSEFSPSATATVTNRDPVIGTWTGTNDGAVQTYTFNDDGTLERVENYDGEEYSDTYTYNSATKRIYYQWGNPPELYGTYSVSGNKLSLTRTYSDSYTRHSGSSGLIGAWRRNYGGTSYDEYEFKSDGKVIERYVSGGEVEDEDEYSYTTSGNKISYSQERHAAQLSGNTLNVYMGGEPEAFTRQSGSGVVGTWKIGEGNEAITLVITSSKVTISGAQSGEYPCRIEGNDLYITRAWEFSFIIDTSATPHILTLTEEWTETYDRVTE
jgi:hypothetical protein